MLFRVTPALSLPRSRPASSSSPTPQLTQYQREVEDKQRMGGGLSRALEMQRRLAATTTDKSASAAAPVAA